MGVNVTPHYSSEHARLYCGDALGVLCEMETGSVDAVIADPPYSSGGMVRGDRTASVHTKYVQSDSITGTALPAFVGDTRDQRGYAYWSTLWLTQAMRITQPGGVVAVFTDWRQLPTVTDAVQAAGLVWRGVVAWCKPNGRRVQGRFANNNEYLVWGTHGPRPLNALPYTLNGHYVINTPRSRVHITQKPIELLRDLVRIAPPGGTVLDPFAGSGSTGVAALAEGRRFVGIEIDPYFAAITADQLAAAEHEQPAA
ncbi:methyltransferase [Actinoplanes lobatus]|uniref:Methyltransferase n=1 Tax=Actinoplanes lobatus TaxID=113568 RepID=A0A7W7HC22_9ACTN|nr:site-specific DNA-methyltransferase [Actinoplanes lobatus]MBB4747763.1 site-specific DNA-methyltransferase (adenine-specific) [Actinoplanes lobatus]GGN96074.1 methyltransferase [Actinoplanes lobatus]GIE45163.1 methyltransferase [Actinoplanes lobatus]